MGCCLDQRRLWSARVHGCQQRRRTCLRMVRLAVRLTFVSYSHLGYHARFANMTSVAGLMSWFGICVTYVRFYAGMKAQGIDRRTLPFRGPLQPYLGWYGVISTIVICFVRPPPLSSSRSAADPPTHAVQRLERVPQGFVGVGHIRDELPPARALPDHVRRRAHLAAHALHRRGGHGLQVRPCGGRGCVLRGAAAGQLGRACLGVAHVSALLSCCSYTVLCCNRVGVISPCWNLDPNNIFPFCIINMSLFLRACVRCADPVGWPVFSLTSTPRRRWAFWKVSRCSLKCHAGHGNEVTLLGSGLVSTISSPTSNIAYLLRDSISGYQDVCLFDSQTIYHMDGNKNIKHERA